MHFQVYSDEEARSKLRAKYRLTSCPTPGGMCVILLGHFWPPKDKGKVLAMVMQKTKENEKPKFPYCL